MCTPPWWQAVSGYRAANLDVSNAIGLVANLRAVRMRLELKARTPQWVLRALTRDIDKADTQSHTSCIRANS